jgi:alkanesulfonate monooxygenase SsuD/methylene tetrahydromethanopterin reductase-like flavin-dependent oxidoreductase (luciferase family)
MAKTQFGIFSLSQVPDLARVVESFDEDLGFFELAEELGYDKVWIAEHLFSTYGLVTSTQVYAAAIAQRTKRIRIGMAVCAVPFNHPLRTASDFALVDVLSHGRLDFGVGRAYQLHEFIGLGVPMNRSREMLAEGLDIILKSWTQEKISYRGEFWTIPEPVELLPKPVQKPHPPIYQATISPESFEQAARSGVHLQMASPFTYRWTSLRRTVGISMLSVAISVVIPSRRNACCSCHSSCTRTRDTRERSTGRTWSGSTPR